MAEDLKQGQETHTGTDNQETKATQTEQSTQQPQKDEKTDTQAHNKETTSLSWFDLAGGEAGSRTDTQAMDTPQQTPQANQTAQTKDLEVIKELAKSFGIDPESVSSIEELKQKLQGKLEQAPTKAVPQPATVKQEKIPYQDDIEKLQKYLILPEDEMIKAWLSELGMSKDEIDDYVDKLAMSDMLSLKATEVKAQINAKLKEYQRLAQQAIEQARLQREQELERARQEFIMALNNINDIGGIPIATSKEQAEQIRKDIYNYVTSGQFAEEIFSAPENLAQAAMLWRWRDKIFEMIKSSATQSAKAEFMKSLTHANNISRATGLPPTGSSGVDLSKFLEGIK